MCYPKIPSAITINHFVDDFLLPVRNKGLPGITSLHKQEDDFCPKKSVDSLELVSLTYSNNFPRSLEGKREARGIL